MTTTKRTSLISKATIDRLPLYFRTLRLVQDEGIDVISSDELGRRLGITPEQIRKDLASFGQFGKKGVGYYVNELKHNVGGILGLDNHWNIAVVGIDALNGSVILCLIPILIPLETGICAALLIQSFVLCHRETGNHLAGLQILAYIDEVVGRSESHTYIAIVVVDGFPRIAPL